jgi:hypothetical protein
MALTRVVTLDTQVLMEIIAPADLYRKLNEDDEVSDAVRERQRRTVYSLALAWQFHVWGTRTVVHDDEAIRIIEKVAPPADETYTVGVVSLFAHEMRHKILPNWKWRTSKKDLPACLRGTQVDDGLLTYALKERVPLITRDAGLTVKAAKAGVAAFAPEGYLMKRHADPKLAVMGLLNRYVAVAEALPHSLQRKAMLAYQEELETILLCHDFFR